MKDYRCWEIGMLVGAALGGLAAVAGFTVTGNEMYFIFAGIGIAAGIAIGNGIDRKTKEREIGEEKR